MHLWKIEKYIFFSITKSYRVKTERHIDILVCIEIRYDIIMSYFISEETDVPNAYF